MTIARSFWRKAMITLISAVLFVSLYEVTILDSQYAARRAPLRESTRPPGVRLAFSATAYCKGVTTTSGVQVTTGVAAADPELLPVGSVIDVETRDARYDGIYTVMDTGPSVQGRQLDIYMWSCTEALMFGRKPIRISVLRLGWDPRATGQSLTGRALTPPAPQASAPRALRTD
jgi:3D (Asp-Asp-Asp) domain-containing protein